MSLTLCFDAVHENARIAEARGHRGEPTPIDSHATVFLDDLDGRRLALVNIESIYDAEVDASRLRFRVRAVGPGVEAIQGYRGLNGGNRYTGEMLELLAAHSSIGLELHKSHGLDESLGIVTYSSRDGFVPERRRGSDGSIEYHSRGPVLPIELIVESGPVPSGRRTIELTAFGEPRMRLLVDADAGTMSILHAETVHDGHTRSSARRSHAQPAVDRDEDRGEGPADPPIPIPNWERRDLEGRWIVMADNVADHPEHGEAWVRFLADRREFELLQWLALATPEGFRTWGAGQALTDARAPQWIAVAFFACEAPRGHTSEFARRLLMETDRPTVKAWLERHAAAAKTECGRMILSALESVESGGPVDDFAPPIDIRALLSPLRSGARGAPIRDFGDRLTVEEGAGTEFVYEHQIERAIEALTMSPAPVRDEYREDLLAITGNAPDRVRQAAFLAWTHLDGTAIPIELSLRTLRSDDETGLVREAAYLALSFAASGTHPIVYSESIRILGEIDHPAWNAAVSRLGDLGDEFALDRMRELEDSTIDLAPTRRKHLGESADRLEQSLRVSADSKAEFPTIRVLERTAWLELSGAEAASAYFQWARATLTGMADSPRMRSPLGEIASTYECPYDGEGFPCQLVQNRVRELAAKFAGARDDP
ncbi:MAG: hypothetical protein ACF8PN_16765 [Phycisphaerales bacterium]